MNDRGPLAGLWMGPALLGGVLILLGILIFVLPQLLAYAVALALILAGLGMIAMGYATRMQVTYRRVDGFDREE